MKQGGILKSLLFVSCSALIGQATAQDGGKCGSLANGYGPFDYRTTFGEPKRLVEGAHFPPMVENLVKGHRGYLGGDIDYTLRAFPNHHRALLSMMNYRIRSKQDPPPNMRYTAECYFDRAVRFRPNDGAVKMLYGFYLLKLERNEEAISLFNEARGLIGEDPNLNYNLGLAYLKLKDYDKALEFAHKAYAGGFPLPGLKRLLQDKGHWVDPVGEPNAVADE